MYKLIKFILKKISRLIYELIPSEYKNFNPKKKLYLKIEDHTVDETFEHFKNDFKKSVLFKDKSLSIREYAIKNALLNDKNSKFFYLEFGTYKGVSTNLFSKHVKKFYTFDSFEGLSNDWSGRYDRPKGYFKLKEKPKLNPNVECVKGLIENTLDNFLITHKPKINFIHFDLDTYEVTKFTLKRVKPYLLKNAILIFDDFYNYFGWSEGEYKAFKEIFDESEFKYRAFDLNDKVCVIQLK